MFDHLDEHSRIKAAQPLIAVGQRTLDEADPRSLRVVHVVQLEPAGGLLERTDAYVGADDQCFSSSSTGSNT
jgi:hypothetical protein